MKVSMIKKVKLQAAPVKPMAPGDKISEFQLVDNGSGSYLVQGVTAAGNPADISQVAVLTVDSSDPSKVAVDSIIGSQFALRAMGPLTSGNPVNVTITATWSDSSIGPFTFVAPANVVAGPVAGLQVIELGQPVLS